VHVGGKWDLATVVAAARKVESRRRLNCGQEFLHAWEGSRWPSGGDCSPQEPVGAQRRGRLASSISRDPNVALDSTWEMVKP
jgi:hypothetical protein